MNREELLRLASERFDQPEPPLPENASELEAWEDWTLIADHLEKTEVLALPSDFAQQVQRRIQDVRRPREFVLVLQVACITCLVLTGVTAGALGFDWWQRLLAAVQPGNVADLLAAFPPVIPRHAPDFAAIRHQAEPILRLLPSALVCTATFVLLIELAIFRLLRLGLFRVKPSILSTPHNSVS